MTPAEEKYHNKMMEIIKDYAARLKNANIIMGPARHHFRYVYFRTVIGPCARAIALPGDNILGNDFLQHAAAEDKAKEDGVSIPDEIVNYDVLDIVEYLQPSYGGVRHSCDYKPFPMS